MVDFEDVLIKNQIVRKYVIHRKHKKIDILGQPFLIHKYFYLYNKYKKTNEF